MICQRRQVFQHVFHSHYFDVIRNSVLSHIFRCVFAFWVFFIWFIDIFLERPRFSQSVWDSFLCLLLLSPPFFSEIPINFAILLKYTTFIFQDIERFSHLIFRQRFRLLFSNFSIKHLVCVCTHTRSYLDFFEFDIEKCLVFIQVIYIGAFTTYGTNQNAISILNRRRFCIYIDSMNTQRYERYGHPSTENRRI